MYYLKIWMTDKGGASMKKLNNKCCYGCMKEASHETSFYVFE